MTRLAIAQHPALVAAPARPGIIGTVGFRMWSWGVPGAVSVGNQPTTPARRQERPT